MKFFLVAALAGAHRVSSEMLPDPPLMFECPGGHGARRAWIDREIELLSRRLNGA